MSAKRPPRQVWVLFDENGIEIGVYPRKKDATAEAWLGEFVVGPYVLAERVAQK